MRSEHKFALGVLGILGMVFVFFLASQVGIARSKADAVTATANAVELCK